MPDYMFVYYGGKAAPPSTAERDKSMKVWMAWFKKLGKAVIEMGGPTGPGKTVTKAGARATGKNGVAGYTIVRANNLSAAANLAKTHPDVQKGMKVEVYQLEKM